jgi:hypothetical protein
MAMEVHNALRHDMDCFIKECAFIFHNRQIIFAREVGWEKCFMTHAKFLLISTFPSGFPFLEFMEFYGCLEILGFNCQ